MDINKHKDYLVYLVNKHDVKNLDVEFLLKIVSIMLEFIDENVYRFI